MQTNRVVPESLAAFNSLPFPNFAGKLVMPLKKGETLAATQAVLSGAVRLLCAIELAAVQSYDRDVAELAATGFRIANEAHAASVEHAATGDFFGISDALTVAANAVKASKSLFSTIAVVANAHAAALARDGVTLCETLLMDRAHIFMPI